MGGKGRGGALMLTVDVVRFLLQALRLCLHGGEGGTWWVVTCIVDDLLV